jgi:hypothetical protein
MTSANVIEYTIYKNKKTSGRFSKNIMCKYPDYAELLIYQPLNEYTILAWGYNEDEEYWEDEEENLEIFLKRINNKWIKDYFNGVKTEKQIIQEIEEIEKERYKKFKEHWKKEIEKWQIEKKY